MSIEQKIEDLTTQVKALTAVLAATLAFQQSAAAPSEPADEAAKPTAAEKKAAAAEKKAAEKKAAAEKAAAEKAAAAEQAEAESDGLDDDDGLNDAGGEREYNLAEMKEVLLALKDKAGDKAAPLAVLAKFGYTGIPSVAEKDATAIGRAAQEALDKL